MPCLLIHLSKRSFISQTIQLRERLEDNSSDYPLEPTGRTANQFHNHSDPIEIQIENNYDCARNVSNFAQKQQDKVNDFFSKTSSTARDISVSSSQAERLLPL